MPDPTNPTPAAPAAPAAPADATPAVAAATDTAAAATEGPKSALEAFDAGLKTADPVAADPAAPPAADPANPEPPADPNAPADEPFSEKDLLHFRGRGRERVAKMISQLKEVEPMRIELQAAKERAAEADEWEKVMKATGANEEEFGGHVALLAAMKSDDPAKLTQAYQVLEQQLAEVGARIGKGPAAKLDADLQAEVEAGTLSKVRAEEMHQLRRRGELTQQHGQRMTEQQKAAHARTQGVQALNQLETQLKASDPLYATKMQYLKGTLPLIAQNFPPQEWAMRLKAAYDALPPIGPPSPPASSAAPPPGHMPLRPTGNGAGMKPEPKSPLEAFEQGLSSVQG